MSTALNILLSWLRSRMLFWKIAALWALILLGVLLAAPELLQPFSPQRIIWIAGLTLLLITAFRLWDDVADIAYDRVRNAENVSERVLLRQPVPKTELYGISALLLSLAGLCLYQHYGWLPLIGLLLLSLSMLFIYYVLPALTARRTLRNTLVLLKYPAMLILLTGGQADGKTLLVAAVLYGLLVIYETYTA